MPSSFYLDSKSRMRYDEKSGQTSGKIIPQFWIYKLMPTHPSWGQTSQTCINYDKQSGTWNEGEGWVLIHQTLSGKWPNIRTPSLNQQVKKVVHYCFEQSFWLSTILLNRAFRFRGRSEWPRTCVQVIWVFAHQLLIDDVWFYPTCLLPSACIC